MNRFVHTLLLSLLLFSATHVYAERSFVISPSVGDASIANVEGYKNSSVVRVDGTFHPIPQFGVNVFVASYPGFDSSGTGNAVSVKISGYGAGVTGRWPVHPHVQPYIRLDYMRWNAEATGLGRTLAKENGTSSGLAVGLRFPIKKFFGIKAEASGYNNVSDADIRQFSVGLTFEF
jgi:hypothetical protein